MMKSQYQQGNSKYSNCVIYCFMVDNFCQHFCQLCLHLMTYRFETNLSYTKIHLLL